jgi:5'-3' exonuclease
MGLSGFLSFLRKKVPQVIREEHLSLYAYERVFIDISGYLYRYICTFGKEQHRWVVAILQFLAAFRDNKVIPIPVFDGKPPQEKNDEIQERREKRTQLSARIQSLQNALEEYKEHKKNQIDCSQESLSVLQTELERLEQRGQRMGSLLSNSSGSSGQAGFKISSKDIELLEQTLKNIQRQHIVITDEDTQLLKKVLDDFGISWIQSPSESESYCAFLIRDQAGSAMVSCDSDSLAHLAPDLILDVELSGKIVRIELEELLESLHITPEQMIDYAILMGCDYNKHVKTNKLGPVNALKYVQQYGRIEDIPDHLLDKECLLYPRCRELFQPHFESIVVYFKTPNEEKIREWATYWKLNPSLIQKFLV